MIKFMVVGGQCLGKDGTQRKGGEHGAMSKKRRQAMRVKMRGGKVMQAAGKKSAATWLQWLNWAAQV
jgi:hypothetical protein